MTDYNDGKWHGWNGGECPVHPNSGVEIVLRHRAEDWRFSKGTGWAQMFEWSGCDEGDIIAFRVIKPYREPREWWICGAFVYRDEQSAREHGTASEIIRVREVIDE